MCDLCEKQYAKPSEYENHLTSYDHHHKKVSTRNIRMFQYCFMVSLTQALHCVSHPTCSVSKRCSPHSALLKAAKQPSRSAEKKSASAKSRKCENWLALPE